MLGTSQSRGPDHDPRDCAQKEQSCPRNVGFGHGQAVMDENKYRGEGWARRERGGERGGGYLILAVPVSGKL